MAFELGAMTNEDGKASGGFYDKETGVGFTVSGLPGLPGDPTQSELERHIISEMKVAMQRAIATATK